MDVETLLTTKDIYFMPKGSDFLVRCLNPEHADKNPSMRIDQITGIFNCFLVDIKEVYLTILGKGQISYNRKENSLRRNFYKSALKVLVCPFLRIGYHM